MKLLMSGELLVEETMKFVKSTCWLIRLRKRNSICGNEEGNEQSGHVMGRQEPIIFDRSGRSFIIKSVQSFPTQVQNTLNSELEYRSPPVSLAPGQTQETRLFGVIFGTGLYVTNAMQSDGWGT